jgi:hypothetical protein
MARIFVNLDSKVLIVLSRLSRDECRSLQEQAAYIIRLDLKRRGLLDPSRKSPSDSEESGSTYESEDCGQL